ncbi:Aldo/keto reductase, partial [Lophium mytilinum]
MALMPAPPAPKSLLGRHRLLAPTAAVKVSPICLGAMNFGDAWKDILGECNKETSFAMLDYFYEQGGNFIDTAVNYQYGESEQWIGEWMETRGTRDEMVIATKYTGTIAHSLQKEGLIASNYGGNNSKAMHLCVETSLRKLKTSYIDLYYVHLWDYSTSIPELMKSLDNLVVAGKVLYLGISDTPAWLVVKANDYARQHGLRQFSVYQGQWSAATRDFEREIIPMCLAEGMGIAPWGALGGGSFRLPGVVNEGGRKLPGMQTHAESVAVVLDKVAKRKGSVITSVAMAYVMHKTPYVFPICGGRKVEHLKGNIEALALQLTKEDIDEIEAAYPFEIGFPHSMLAGANKMVTGPEGVSFASRMGYFDWVESPRPI